MDNVLVETRNTKQPLSPLSSPVSFLNSKKLIIKKSRGQITLPKNYENETIEVLSETIKTILNSEPIHNSYEQLYQAVENMCCHKMALIVYEQLHTLISNHLSTVNEEFKLNLIDLPSFLTNINKYWITFGQQMLTIRSIFLYMDRTYVLQNTTLLSIRDLGLNLFCNCLLTPNFVSIIQVILTLINDERQNSLIDRVLLKSVIKMFLDTGLYSLFEHNFITATKSFYSTEGNDLILKLNTRDYLRYVKKRFDEENDRLLSYIHSSSIKTLLHTVEEQLLSKHVNNIFKEDFESLIDTDCLDDLKLFYSLLSRIDKGHNHLCTVFNDYIKKRGSKLIEDEVKEKLIQELINFKDKIDKIINSCFDSNTLFVNSCRSSFENFVNQCPNKLAELLAKFIDLKLRAGNKEASIEEMESLLDKLMVLFRFIHGKDVFEAFYKQCFAKRLLMNKSACVDIEKSMLSKLKEECGVLFTSKLEGMFKDIELSKDINIAFKQFLVGYKDSECNITFEISVNILTTGTWPTYPIQDIYLPYSFVHLENVFEVFYEGLYSGRQLIWQTAVGYCIVRVNFSKYNKELQVSLCQTLVLLLFNDNDTLTFEEIQTATRIEANNLKQILQTLSCFKAKILNKTPKGRDVNDDDQFSFNDNFKHKLFRVKMNQMQMNSTVEEQKATEERVFQDRQYQVDAAVVRIMKSYKTISHNELIGELFKYLNFPVKPVDLKKRIESLIDRDYIQRDKQKQNCYVYVA